MNFFTPDALAESLGIDFRYQSFLIMDENSRVEFRRHQPFGIFRIFRNLWVVPRYIWIVPGHVWVAPRQILVAPRHIWVSPRHIWVATRHI